MRPYGWQRQTIAVLACLTLAAVAFARSSGNDPPSRKSDTKAIRPHLEFRIAANPNDDESAIKLAREYFAAARSNPERKAELQKRASQGLPPEAIELTGDETASYSWFEIGPSQLPQLLLDEIQEKDLASLSAEAKAERKARWNEVAAARDKGEPMLIGALAKCLVWSRVCSKTIRPGGPQARQKYEYFMLTRDQASGKEITEKHLVAVRAQSDDGQHSVAFELNKEGGALMHDLSARNKGQLLAIVVDGVVLSAPTIVGPFDEKGRLIGNFSREYVEQIVDKLRADIPR